MKDQFYHSPKFAKKELAVLQKRKNKPAIIRFVVMILFWLVSAITAVYCWEYSWWMIASSQLFFGLMCCSTFACLHESAHGTAFGSRRLNQIAALICGVLHVYPNVLFKELHFMHHRYTHVPGKDPEISIGKYLIPSVITSLPSYLGWLTGAPLLSFKVLMISMSVIGMPEPIRQLLFPFIRPKVRSKLFLDALVTLVFWGGIIYVASTIDAKYWALIVGQVIGHSLLAAYTAAEHNGLPHEGSILQKTRSISASSMMKLIMWNMPYHAEHHAFPAVPFHNLPELHLRLKDELPNKSQNHREFHGSVIIDIFKK